MKQPHIISSILTTILFTACITGSKSDLTDEEKQGNQIELNDSLKDVMFSLDLDSVKTYYGEDFGDLRTIVNNHDPIGLLTEGAPIDEYDPEVKSIIILMDKDFSELQIHNLVYNEFYWWFGDTAVIGPKTSYQALSNDVYRWNQTGFYINGKGEAPINTENFYVDEDELGQ